MIVAQIPDLDHRGKLGVIRVARATAAIAVLFFMLILWLRNIFPEALSHRRRSAPRMAK